MTTWLKITPIILPKRTAGLCLLSNIFGRAEDLVASIQEVIPRYDDAAKLIVYCIYKGDPLSVVSVVLSVRQKLENTPRGPQESYAAFEGGFQAQLSRFNGLDTRVAIPVCLAELDLLCNENVDINHRISILWFWSDDSGKYLKELEKRCGACQATVKPRTSGKVSLSSLSRESSELLCVDHCFIQVIPVFHAMDAGSRYSTAAI